MPEFVDPLIYRVRYCLPAPLVSSRTVSGTFSPRERAPWTGTWEA
jgi:hypothetical protein